MLKQKLFSLVVITSLITCSNNLFSQNNTSSPFSIFGIGLDNKTATGNLSALGNSGIANTSSNQINILNPASLGNIKKNNFLYEFGANFAHATIKNDITSRSTYNGNISHVAIAFPIRHNWGFGLGLLPKTKVGYNITLESPIEGSTDTFLSIINGEGGINQFYLASGFKLGKAFSVGIQTSFLFGSIEQKTQAISNSLITIEDTNNYNGVNFQTGFQYSFFDSRKTTIGGLFEFPASLNGVQTRSSNRSIDGSITIIENEVENNLDDFNLPIRTGIGITSNVYSDFVASFDFTKTLWEEIKRNDNQEQFKNQDIYAFGLEYAPSKRKLKYLNRLKYRLGFNYNSGALHVSNKNIDSYFLSLGAGIPLDKNANNIINLSYSYGKEGNVDNNLVQENFHKLTLNLSLISYWFKERKIF